MGKPLINGKFELFQIGKIVEDDANYHFVYTDVFSNNGMSIDDFKSDGFAEHLAAYSNEKKLNGESRVNEDGFVEWNNLDLGLYLIIQTEKIDGYYILKPFIVSVPLKIENSWIYDVNGNPKFEFIPDFSDEKELTVQKIWKDDGQSTPTSIKVKLFKDNIEFDTCILNAKNNWTMTWKHLSNESIWSVKEINVPKGYTVSYTSSGLEIVITNTSTNPNEPPLIDTGQLNWPIPLLAFIGIILFCAGWKMTFMKKVKRNEK